MKKIFFFLLPIFLFAACKTAKSTDANSGQPPQANGKSNGFVEATVIDYTEVAGCGFLLMLSDENKLRPDQLGEEFKKDQLKVLVKYVIEDKPNVCMAGKGAHILEIKKK